MHVSDLEPLPERLKVLGKGGVLDLLQAVQILVGIEHVVGQLDHGDGHVGAVVADPLVVGEKCPGVRGISGLD